MLAALALLLASEAPAAEPLEDLLARVAVGEARMLEVYETATFVVKTTVRDAATFGKSTHEIETRLFTKDGKPWEEIVLYIEDGEDITKKANAHRQEELESGKRKRKHSIPFESPFAEEQQPLYVFTDLGADPSDPSRRRIAFEPRKKGEKAYVGEASIEVGRAAIRRLSFKPSVYPRFVSKMNVEMEIDAETPAGPALSVLRVSGAGKFLFYRKRITLEAKLSGYQLAPSTVPQ